MLKAIQEHNITKVRELIDSGANVNEPGSLHRGSVPETPLMFASQRGYTDIATLLIDKGADLDFQDPYGDTALIGAVKQNSVNTIKLLLEKGANVYVKDSEGRAAADLARTADIKKMIIKKMAQPVGEVVVKKGLPAQFGRVVGEYVVGPKRKGATRRKHRPRILVFPRTYPARSRLHAQQRQGLTRRRQRK